MTNLLTETSKAIKDSGHTPDDISFIGSADGKFGISWKRFGTVAAQDYDSGFGSAEVATDLIIVFRDGKKMWRHEYDGSENWEYDAPGDVHYDGTLDNITELVGSYWPSIEALHSDDPDTRRHYGEKSRSGLGQ